jgi:hypothetical protein
MAEANAEEAKMGASEIDQIAAQIRQLAQQREADSIALLELLRMMERVHREISDGVFQNSLPTNRQALHSFLRDIESQGGWPYIYSRKLKMVLSELAISLLKDAEQNDEDSNSPS